MGYWDLRRLLRAIARADDRWRLHEAWWNPDPVDWRATVDDIDTGLWYTLDRFTDLTVRHPVLPPGQPPQPHPWWRHDASHDSGDPGALSADGASCWRSWTGWRRPTRAAS